MNGYILVEEFRRTRSLTNFTVGTDELCLVDPVDVPLSWHRTENPRPQFRTVALPLSGMTWVAYADLPHDYDLARCFRSDLEPLPGGFLIRGCSPELTQFFAARGCETLRDGVEAVLDLQTRWWERRSVRRMAAVAQRSGVVREVPWSETAMQRLRCFADESRYGELPQLRYLFRSQFEPGMRLFVFSAPHGAWYAALLLAPPHATTAVAEMMVRARNAPPGVMEGLFTAVGRQLQQEGMRWLSLNEVPFHHFAADLGLKERAVGLIGRSIRWAYNAAGLLSFKAKFAPQWRSVAICGYPRLPLTALADMFIASGCMDLVQHCLLHGVMGSLPHPFTLTDRV